MPTNDITTKRCGRCRAEKPRAEFGKDRSRKDGLEPRCKSCRSKPRADWKPRVYRTSFPSRWKHKPGDRFAELVIVARVGKVKGQSGVLVQCDCGAKPKIVGLGNLVRGDLVNCADRANHPDPRSKGFDIGYWAAHHRATAVRGPASDHKCRLCPKQAVDWAYGHGADGQTADESGREAGLPFSPDPLDYWPLCRSHHRQFDMARARSSKGGYDLAYFALWALLRQGEELHELENGSVV